MNRALLHAARCGLVLVAVVVASSACESTKLEPDPDATSDSQPVDPCLVTTTSGPVQGKVASTHCAFLDIPFAKPPVGNLRWKPPEPPEPWTAPHDATQPGPWCPQVDLNIPLLRPGPIDEDCLTLAVWAPTSRPNKAPVMVSLHAGVFINGSKSWDLVDGAPLAVRQGVVVVGMNYRLGALGQMAHPKLGEGMVNFSLLDQQAALRWVRDNIAAFGGDPNNVTIFGESAGGISVCLHLVSPKSKGLFHRAITQGGSCTTAQTRAEAEAYGQFVSKTVGCDGAADEAACLRSASAQELANVPILPLVQYGGSPYLFPFVDGVTLLEQPTDSLASGNFNKVPLLAGTNADAGTAATTELRALDAENYLLLLENRFSREDAAKVAAQYDPARFGGKPVEAMTAVLTDSIFACPTRRLARAMASAGQPVYLYQFAHAPALIISLDPFFRATQSAEVSFVYGTRLLGVALPPDEKPLSNTMMGYWARFAATGDPNGDNAPTWPKYSEPDERYLELTLTPTEKRALKKTECDFWQGFSEF
ncbi:MAG: carboxylesterase family protein [Myxococcales bacterium]|nr:carboxylesterase family protein [Myxococcales bacterium]